MKKNLSQQTATNATYYVDEAGDGVLFGSKGRNLLEDPVTPRFFMLGMVRCADDAKIVQELQNLRNDLLGNPLYASIYSMRPEVGKTARNFHAKDDHAEVRAKVFELLTRLDFKFFAVIKDMRAVLRYVTSRNATDDAYRYHPNELYDLTVRMLFKQRLHQHDHYRITFARRGSTDRTKSLQAHLEDTRRRFLDQINRNHDTTMEVIPAYPWQSPCLQVTDYCLWALQRCYEKHQDRFLKAIWSKVSLIHDVDDPNGKRYGTFSTRNDDPPDVEKIKCRWI